MRVEIDPVVAGVDVTDDFTFVRLEAPPAFDRNTSAPIRTGSRGILLYVRDSDAGSGARLVTESQVCLNIGLEGKADQEHDRQENRQPGKTNT